MPGIASVGSYGPPLPNGIPGRRGSLIVGDPTLSPNIATTSNLPSGVAYDVEAGVGGRLTFSQDVNGWDFSQVNARCRQNVAGIAMDNCTFGLSSDYSINNRAYMFPGNTENTHFILRNCTFLGRNFTASFVTRLIGNDSTSPNGAPSLIQNCKFLDVPFDWISGIIGVTGQQTIIENNYARITGVQGSAIAHPDGIQLVEWSRGNGLIIRNNVIDLRPLPGNTDFSTAPINLSVEGGLGALTGNFSVDVNIEDNILIGGSYSIYCGGVGEGTASGAMNIVRQYVSDSQNGPLYPGQAVMSTLVMNNIKNANTGAALTFSYNNGSSTQTVSSIP